MDIVSPYPLWYFIFCFLIGALYAFILYRKDKKLSEFSPWLITLLSVFRLISVSIICLLLLSPLVKYFSKTIEKPIVIIATDNSASMRMSADSSGLISELNSSIAKLKLDLEQQYEVASFLFDEKLEKQDSAARFNGSISNFQQLFSSLDDRFVNRNVGGLILISDGIYNQGSNPLYLSNQLSYPIYAVATGDTSIIKDAKVAQVRTNEIAFFGNNFPLEIDLKVLQADQEMIRFRVLTEGEIVYSGSFETGSNDVLKTVKTNLEAESTGVQKYTVEVLALDGERNLLNNRMDFYIDVLDGRQKIALVGLAPHPDIASIKRSIEKNENYELNTFLLKDVEKVEDYDLIVLHNSSSFDQAINGPLREIVESTTPLFIIGNGWGNLAAQFGLSSARGKKQRQDSETYPILNENFSLFTISERLANQINRFPPLNGFAVNIDLKQANTSLFYQKIGNIDTKFPLFVFYEKDKRKIGRLFADGLWKWSMNDFIENESHLNFNELIGKTIQYLALKSDRSNFRVNTANEYFENEEIVFNAQVFNQSYELINEEDVALELVDEGNKKYQFNFNKNQNSYQLSIASLPSGRYEYAAITSLQGVKYRESGTFTVKELQLEQLETVANHNLLFQLAERTGGELVYPSNMQDISKLFASRNDIKAISYVNEEVEDLINLRWIFFIIGGLLIVEWFIRKRNGAY